MGIRSTITDNYQITIPAAIVRELQLESGMQMEWEIGHDRCVIIRPVESRYEKANRLDDKVQPEPGDNPIGDLIGKRIENDQEC